LSFISTGQLAQSLEQLLIGGKPQRAGEKTHEYPARLQSSMFKFILSGHPRDVKEMGPAAPLATR
jgi:hypothetical protein